MMDCEIITVNYNTPDLAERLVKSIRSKEGNIPVRIIDGSNSEYADSLTNILSPFDSVIIEKQGYNIHHGRGMDLALSTSKFKYCLIMDSDNYIKTPVIRYMLDNIGSHKMFGWYCYVNDHGISSLRVKTDQNYIKYYHPSFLLIDTEFYNKSQAKMIHHGAPCLEFMKEHNHEMDSVALDLCESLNIGFNDLNRIISLKGRGTVSRFGYNLR